jgi:hypothetical protein
MSLRIVDGEPSEIFAVREALDCSLQGCLRVAFQVAFNVSSETFGENLGAVLQIVAQSALQNNHLIVRSTQRDESDADDERDDKAGAE